MADDIDRVLDALAKSTEASVSLEARVEHLISRQELLDDRVSGLEDGMGTMNAHLDNLEREAAKTNDLLERDFNFRQEQYKEAKAEKRRQQELDRKDQDDRRALALKAASEVWTVFKQPLATLVLAISAYLVWAYFQIPPTPSAVEVKEVPAVAAPIPEAEGEDHEPGPAGPADP